MFFKLAIASILTAPLLVSAGVRHDLELLYPDQSSQVMDQRISLIKSKEDFFRSFTPYFYLRVRENLAKENIWSGLVGEQAWCAGDPHPANYGALWTPKGNSIFTINDVDDANPCPVFVDVFRFLTGWSLVDKDVPLPLLLKAYFAGLQSSNLPANPPAIQQLIAQSQRQGPEASSKWLNRKGEFKDSAELVKVKPNLEKEIRAQAQLLAGPQWQIVDFRERLRFEGGSGGLKRFLTLMRRDSLVPPQFILLEMKEISRPGTFPLNVPRLDPMTRILQALQWEQRPALTSWQKGVSLFGRPFQTRLLIDGNIGIKPDHFSKSDRLAIALNEAALLGVLHRTGGASKNYATKATAIPPEAWQQATTKLRDDIEDAFKKIH